VSIAEPFAGALEAVLLDIPPLRDEWRKEPGLLVAARSADPGRAFRGAILSSSSDDGTSWQRLTEITREAALGELVTPPSVTVSPGMWDRANTIRVAIKGKEIQVGNVSEDACLAGQNRFLIGSEIIGAARASFVSYDALDEVKTYDLSVLLRGQQDTDHEMDAHAAGEIVCWLDGPQGLQFLPLPWSYVDKPRLWKFVPHGGHLEDSESVLFAPTARNCKPFHVRDIRISRDGSNNITWTWERASRAARTFLQHGEPLDEEVEEYSIDVFHAGTLKRTISVTGARTAAYSAAQQIADGNTPGAGHPVTCDLFQVSQSFLRGPSTRISL